MCYTKHESHTEPNAVNKVVYRGSGAFKPKSSKHQPKSNDLTQEICEAFLTLFFDYHFLHILRL